MKTLLTTLALLAALLRPAAAQTNVVTASVGDIGLSPSVRSTVTVTLLSPLARAVGNQNIKNDPIAHLTDAAGNAYFTNLQWGNYQADISGKPGTSFTFVVATNTAGAVSMASLRADPAAVPPDPAASYYNQAQVNALLASLTTPATGGAILYVDQNGSNATGTRGRADKPFQTIGKAKTNAVAGDTIIVNPGTYFENDLAKDGITVQCMNGVVISYDAEDFKPGRAAAGIVDDRWTGAVNFKLLGKPDVYYSTGTNSNVTVSGAFDNQGYAGCTNSLGMLMITNPASRVTVELGRVQYASFTPQLTLGAVNVLNCTNAIVRVDDMVAPYYSTLLLTTNVDTDIGGFISLRSQVMFVYWELGEFHFYFNSIGPCEQYGIWANEPGDAATVHTNSGWFTGDTLLSKLYISGHSGTYRTWFDFKELHTTNAPFSANMSIFGGKNYIRAEKISDDWAELIDMGGGTPTSVNELWLTVQKMSGPSTWVSIANSKSVANISCQQFEEQLGGLGFGNGLAKFVVASGATLNITGQYARSAGKLVDWGGGHGLIQNMELRSTNNVAVGVRGSGLMLQHCLLLSNTASNSIYATNAQTVGVSSAMANTAKSSSVTLSPLGTFTVDNNLQ